MNTINDCQLTTLFSQNNFSSFFSILMHPGNNIDSEVIEKLPILSVNCLHFSTKNFPKKKNQKPKKL